MTVQSILFDRSIWTQAKAVKWLHDHNYKSSYRGKPVDVTKNKLRYRQRAPKGRSYRTFTLGNGIEFVIMQ